MRTTALAFATLAAVLLFGSSASHADPYRWCAVYGGDMGGASNCGFITLQQCRDTVFGIGGFCEPNQFYTGPDRDESRPVHRRKHKHSR
ncbi:MAG TPA: DUF3551 domain-containing protein [Pseudolabrys sp.]|jgi:hypothetical protein|nr:DUF3551 domain-containing protein [Pseudolabrys sp.]